MSLVRTCHSRPQMGTKGPSGKPRPGFNIARRDPELWELGAGPGGGRAGAEPGWSVPHTSPALPVSSGPIGHARRLRASPAIRAASGLRSWGRRKGRAWREPWGRQDTSPRSNTPGLQFATSPPHPPLLSGGLTPGAALKRQEAPWGQGWGQACRNAGGGQAQPLLTGLPAIAHRLDHTREVGSGPRRAGSPDFFSTRAWARGDGGEQDEPGSPGQACGKYSEMEYPRFQGTGGSTPHPAVRYSRSISGALWAPTEDRVGGEPWDAADSPQDTALPHPLPCGQVDRGGPGGSAYRRLLADRQEGAPSG